MQGCAAWVQDELVHGKTSTYEGTYGIDGTVVLRLQEGARLSKEIVLAIKACCNVDDRLRCALEVLGNSLELALCHLCIGVMRATGTTTLAL